VNLFAEFFQGVYVSECEPVLLPTLNSFTQPAVEKAILRLDEQKGPGPDGILPFILRKLVSVVKVPLTCSVQSVLIDLHFSCYLERIPFPRRGISLAIVGYLFCHDTETF
jgi:hypothetical protein